MLMDVMIRQGRYAPGKLVPPKGEVLYWKQEYKDALGNLTCSVECDNIVEVRFSKPAASKQFIINLRGALSDGEGEEWNIMVPSERMGVLLLPTGFSTEQSIMGAVYRLTQPKNLRVLADQMVKMPGINFTVQILN